MTDVFNVIVVYNRFVELDVAAFNVIVSLLYVEPKNCDDKL